MEYPIFLYIYANNLIFGFCYRLAIRHICHLQSRLQGDKMYENNFLTNSDLEEQQYNAPSTSWAVPYYPSFGLGSPHSYYSYQLDPSQYPQYKTKLKLL